MKILIKRSTIALLTLLVSYQFSSAQYNELIRSGRPGVAIGPFSVGKDVFQIQSGFGCGQNNGLSEGDKNFILGSTVLRYGFTKTIDFNSGWEVKNEKYSNGKPDSKTGLSLSTLGARFNIFESKDKRTGIGFQFNVHMNFLSLTYKQKFIAPSFLLAGSLPLSKKMTLATNIGASYNGNTPDPTGKLVLNLNYALSKKFNVYFENYGSLNQKTIKTGIDAGVAFLFNKNLQFDFSAGYSDNQGLSTSFINGGVSYRFYTKKPKG